MNDLTMALMVKELDRYDRDGLPSVLDVGSLDVNGNHRKMIEDRGWSYTGLDLVPGKNVDVVAYGPYDFDLGDRPEDLFDIVISGSTMEHVQAIWRWVPELVSCLKPGGLLAIVTHWSFPEHRYPLDCWRIMPDGMEYLFDQTARLERYHIRIADPQNIVGSAFKTIL